MAQIGYTPQRRSRFVWFVSTILSDPGAVQGRILEPLPNSLFRVELEGGNKVVAHPAGRARLASVRLLPGDRVLVELSATDPGRGRILSRLV